MVKPSTSISNLIRSFDIRADTSQSSDRPPAPLALSSELGIREKRGIADLSLSPSDDLDHKHARLGDSNLASPTDSIESSLIATLQASLAGFTDKLSNRMDSLDRNINNKIDERFDRLEYRLNSLESRLDSVEAEGRSSRSAVDVVSDRMDALETRTDSSLDRITRLESVPREGGWVPSGPIATSVILCGDSNSGEKLKFGEGKGTLGAALPGDNMYCPKFRDLPPTDSSTFENRSDIVLAVGTNELKSEGSDPRALVTHLHDYIVKLTRRFPATHVHVPGVLPICTPGSVTNTKIKTYNQFISDMCLSFPRVHFVDTIVFNNKDGSLKPNLAKGMTDPLHLNADGLKLYFSRMKFSLRERHGLPPPRSRSRGTPRGNHDRPSREGNSNRDRN